MTAPKAILIKGQVIIFDNDDRASISSKAASYAYHNGSDYRKECYNAAKEYAIKHYSHLLPNNTFKALPIGGKFKMPKGICIKNSDISYKEPSKVWTDGYRERVVHGDFPLIQIG